MSSRIHIRTFAAGCAFTLVVFAATSFSAPVPKAPPTHGISTAVIHDTRSPASDHDRLLALIARVDALQNSDAATRQNERAIVNALNDISAQAQDAEAKASCVTAGYQAAWNQQGQLVANNDEPSLSNFVIAILDPACAS